VSQTVIDTRRNQVPYSLNNRAIERDLSSWCQQYDLPVMAHSPLGGDNNLVLRDARWRRSALHTAGLLGRASVSKAAIVSAVRAAAH
jgi:diketogulonate reductase-like aldo/keto reductase